MVQREQVNFAFRDGLGKRPRKPDKELAYPRKRDTSPALPSAEPMIQSNVFVQPPQEQMLPRAPMEDPQMRQEVRHLPHLPQPPAPLEQVAFFSPALALTQLPSTQPGSMCHQLFVRTICRTQRPLRMSCDHSHIVCLSQMQSVHPFQAATYQPPALQSLHPTSTGGNTIAGPDYAAGGAYAAHASCATAVEEATRAATNAGDVLQTSIQPFFNRTAEAAFPAMLPAANPPAAQALIPFPNGGGVLERGLRRHLKAQGPARPRARRVAPASPPKVVGDGPIGNLCSAAFAADSSAYALGCARASQTIHRKPLDEPP